MSLPDDATAKSVEDLPEDVKREAVEAVRGMKDIANANTMEAIEESSDDAQSGSPRSPGYDAQSGKTMKPSESPALDSTEFDKALAMLQQQDTKADQEHGKDKDLDR